MIEKIPTIETQDVPNKDKMMQESEVCINKEVLSTLLAESGGDWTIRITNGMIIKGLIMHVFVIVYHE